ncbi:MAG TPA: hypothetical protein VN832_13685 [Stellaceae bacterium]|nr:hypothetical protein [Stellaceae bacterium]
MERAEALRELARKYRALAEVGHTGEKAWRLKHADSLDRLADGCERALKATG